MYTLITLESDYDMALQAAGGSHHPVNPVRLLGYIYPYPIGLAYGALPRRPYTALMVPNGHPGPLVPWAL